MMLFNPQPTSNNSTNWIDLINRHQEENPESRKFLRVNSKLGTGQPCAICGAKDWCLESWDGQVCICMREPSDKPITKGHGGWLHKHPFNAPIGDWFSEERERMRREYEEKRQQHIKRQARRLASPEELHKFHTYLLNKYPLKEADKQFLISKGIKDFSDFGTLPPSSHEVYTNHEIDYMPPAGIPGVFYSWNHEKALLNAYAYGIFRVVRNHDGLAVGAEIRISEECAKKTGKESRFEPLSSNGKEQGIAADTKQYAVIRAKTNSHPDSILLTEGINKAAIASDYMQMDAVGLRSVANWRRFVEDLQSKFPAVKRVYVAFDMDRFGNNQVMNHHQNCLRSLKALVEIEVNDMTWKYDKDTKEYKGIDDCFLAGEKPQTILYHKPVFLYNIDTIGDGIQNLVKSIMHNANGKINVISATVGGGKTRGVINTINEAMESGEWFKVKDGDTLRDARVLWMTDNYKLLKESYDEFKYKPSLLKGRQKNEFDENGAPEKFYCAEYELTQHVGRQGQNITVKVCLDCPLFQQNLCSYQNNTKHVLETSNFVMSTKASFFNKSERIEKFDIIIIDESINNAVYTQRSISQRDIDLHQRVLKESQEYADNKYGRSGEIQKTQMLLEWFSSMLELSDKSPMAKAVKIDIPMEFSNVYSKHEKVILQECDDETGSPETHLKLFIAELDDAAVYVWKDQIIMDIPNHDLIDRLNGKTVLNLDATASDSMLKVFGENNVLHHEFQLKEFINIIQDTTLRCSKSQLADEKIQKKILEAIEFVYYAKPDDKVSLLSSKFFIEEVARPYFEERGINIKMGWYGYHSKGFNFMEDSDTLILVGNFCRNLSVMEMRQQTLAHMNIHVDLEELIEEDSLAELIQSIGRGRACRREDNPLNLFLFTNRDISRYYPNAKKIRAFDLLKNSHIANSESGAALTHNEMLQIECEHKVKEAVQKLMKHNQLICDVSRQHVIDKTGLSRDTVVKYMKKLYSEQLVNLSTNEGHNLMELIDEISHSMRAPAWNEMIALGLNMLTHNEAALLNSINIGVSLHVNKGNLKLYNHLKTHIPAGISNSLWQRGIKVLAGYKYIGESKTLEEGGEYQEYAGTFETVSELADLMGMTRQSAAKFFNAYKPILLNYVKDKHKQNGMADAKQMELEVAEEFKPIEEWSADTMDCKDLLKQHIINIADSWHENKLSVREVSVLSKTIQDEVMKLDSYQSIKLSHKANMDASDPYANIQPDDENHSDFFIATRHLEQAVETLICTKILSADLPKEYQHPAYYLEQIANSLRLLQSDSKECYNLCKTIYINWRKAKLKEVED